jgi:hypothetical protein
MDYHIFLLTEERDALDEPIIMVFLFDKSLQLCLLFCEFVA